ncbi:WD40-repeat-containing domain protein [Mycena sanguinolenta]|nr:WD40-repeat-containing domain protein [Mycena sanguinolenta]
MLTRRVEYTLGGHTASVNVVKWGGVGKRVLYTASRDRTLPFPSSSTAVASPTLTTKTKPLGRLVGHSLQVSHVSFSPDGRWAASVSWDSSVRIWEGRTGKYIATLRGRVWAVDRVAWSGRAGRELWKRQHGEGQYRLYRRKADGVQTWDLKTYKLKNDLTGHTDASTLSRIR